MTRSCAVSDCRNTHTNKKSGVTFHRFPIANKSLCDRWVKLCRRQNEFNPTSGANICSEHFSADAYERDLRNELLGLQTRKKLKADAIPTIFPDRGDEDNLNDDVITPRKYPSCMICVSPIIPPPDPLGGSGTGSGGNNSFRGAGHGGGRSEAGIDIPKGTFLKGIGILSSSLNLEKDLGNEEWDIVFGTRVDFPGSVCCTKCGNLLKMLVLLRELILETEIKMMNTVNQLETTVVNSEGLKHEAEYSFPTHTCFRFREEVIKAFQKRKRDLEIETSSIAVRPLPVKRKLKEPNESSINGSESYIAEEESGFKAKRKRKNHPKEKEPSPEIKTECITLEDETSSSTISTKEEQHLEFDFEDQEESNPFPSASPQELNEESNDFNDPHSDSDACRSRRNKTRRGKSKSKQKSDLVNEARIKKRNERENRRKAETLLGGDIPFNLRPFSVIDKSAEILTYYNCKVLLKHDRLLCKHPDCNYEYVFDYFTISMFYAFFEMRKHIRTGHRGRKTGFHSCAFCDLHFDQRLLLIQHVQMEHLTADAFPCLCEICGMSLTSKEFMDHVFTHKNSDELQLAQKYKEKRIRDVLMPKDFPCDKCNHSFDAYSKYLLHSQNHVPIELRQHFQCETCGEWKTSRGRLSEHKRSAHPKDGNPYPYQCNICGRKYNRIQRRRYLTHLLVHSGELPFKCGKCDKRFRSQYNLKLHDDEVHQNQEKVQCEFCAGVFQTLRNLKKHQRNRHRDRITILPSKARKQDEHLPGYQGPKLMFPCEPCGKVFAFKSQLITHLKKQAHKMFLEKNEDYPNMITLDDYPQFKIRRRRSRKL